MKLRFVDLHKKLARAKSGRRGAKYDESKTKLREPFKVRRRGTAASAAAVNVKVMKSHKIKTSAAAAPSRLLRSHHEVVHGSGKKTGRFKIPKSLLLT